MPRPRHPDKHIEQSVRYAESLGWQWQASNGHAWGRLFCPEATREGCIVSVWSTPRVPENHGRHTMNSLPPVETEHDFTLLLDGATAVSHEIEDALFAAGCDDATLSARLGRLFLSFSRTAPSLRDAIVSAVQAVSGCGQGLSVVRVDTCNLVTQSDIARKMDRSRQQVHQYISGQRGPGDFPPPACNITEGMPLWYWSEVADWLAKNNLIKPEVLREAQELAVVNSVLELAHQKQLAPELTLGVMRELGVN